MWPQGTIGPVNYINPQSPPAPPPAPPAQYTFPGECPGGPAGEGVPAMVQLADFNAWGSGQRTLLNPPKDPVNYIIVGVVNPDGSPTFTNPVGLVDTLGVGFPPTSCQPVVAVVSWAEMQQTILANTETGYAFPYAKSPSPPVSPPSPPSPPLPPSPPPPPGCVHVCIDNWPASPPIVVQSPPSPVQPPSPPVVVTAEQLPHDQPISSPIQNCMPNSKAVAALTDSDLYDIALKLGWIDSDGLFPWYEAIKADYATHHGGKGETVPWFYTLIVKLEENLLYSVQSILDATSEVSGCETKEFPLAILVEMAIGFVRKWVADLPPMLTAPWDYFAAWSCPRLLPGAEWANEAYGRTFITQEEWACLVRANGKEQRWQEVDVRLRGKQPTEGDLLLNLRKGTIESYDDFRYAMGILGWVDDNSVQQWYNAQQWMPSPTDAIEWMIKDVGDETIQKTFLLGAEFQQKYTGHVKEVFDWNGVSEIDADHVWRSHWKNIAPGQLYEMHKRLRPGFSLLWSDADVIGFVSAIAPVRRATITQSTVDSRPCSDGFPVPTYLDELITDAPSPNSLTIRTPCPGLSIIGAVARCRAWLESIVTDAFHVNEGLGQDDYPAFWRSRFLAMSYRVMTRVDVRRAYEVGALTPEQAVAKFQDQGYSPPDSLTLLEFYRKAAIQLHSRRPICNQWVKTGYDIKLLEQALISQGMRPDMGKEVSDILILRRKIHIQQECMEGIHKRYVKGMIDETGAKNELLNMNFPVDQVADVVNEWQCVKASKPKTETVAEICNEFRSGILTGKQAQKLIVGLGYSPFAARRILTLCYLQTPPKTRRHAPIPGSPLDAQMQQALDS